VKEGNANKIDLTLCDPIVHNSLGYFNRAVEYYLKAEKIFEKTGQIHYLKVVYENLFSTYKKIKDNKNAEKYKKKLEQIQK